jgi:hypothetical protein
VEKELSKLVAVLMAMIERGIFILVALALLVVGCKVSTNPNDATSDASRLAVAIVTGNMEHHSSEIYLFDPANEQLTSLGNGDAILWSPRGSYLATFTTTFPGLITSFSIWNLQTFTKLQYDYWGADLFSWSPDEKNIVLAGNDHYGCNCFSLLPSDGSKPLSTSSCDACSGYSIGHRFLGWRQDGLLVEVRRGNSGNNVPDGPTVNGLYLFDPIQNKWSVLESSSKPDWSWPREIKIMSWLHTDHTTSSSRDGKLVATAQGNTLAITETLTGRAYVVPLPSSTMKITSFVWSP